MPKNDSSSVIWRLSQRIWIGRDREHRPPYLFIYAMVMAYMNASLLSQTDCAIGAERPPDAAQPVSVLHQASRYAQRQSALTPRLWSGLDVTTPTVEFGAAPRGTWAGAAGSGRFHPTTADGPSHCARCSRMWSPSCAATTVAAFLLKTPALELLEMEQESESLRPPART